MTVRFSGSGSLDQVGTWPSTTPQLHGSVKPVEAVDEGVEADQFGAIFSASSGDSANGSGSGGYPDVISKDSSVGWGSAGTGRARPVRRPLPGARTGRHTGNRGDR